MKKRSIHKYIFEWSKLSNKLISEIYYEKKRSDVDDDDDKT